MAQKIKMNTEKLKKDCNQFEQGILELEKCLQEMEEGVNALNSIWEGPSHDSFMTKYRKDCQQMEELNKGLRKYLEAMEKAQREYAICESRVEELVRGL